jgi:hypothetical protein
MGKASRDKGARGERMLAAELSELLGAKIERRVRNRAGENDLTGLPGWSPEVKHCATASMSAWWAQTIAQAGTDDLPVLFYKLPRRPFRAVISVNLFIGGDISADPVYTVETSLEGFAAIYREFEAVDMAQAVKRRDALLLAGGRMQ